MASPSTNTPIRRSASPGLTIQTPQNLGANINGLRRSPSPSLSGLSPSSATPTSAMSNLGPGGGSMRSRASLGLAQRPASLVSPRNASGNIRPNSELLPPGSSWGSGASPQGAVSPGIGEEGFDKWFANLANYEATLEEMAAASLDTNFKEELGAIEQWFRVLSEAERTAALYSLLQHSTQMQIRFFITVLQQMSRSDPMTAAMFSPAVGSSMEAQMEAKLAALNMKSPGINPALKSPSSPASRAFHANFLSPDSAMDSDPAGLLASQRAKLKANRISAPSPLWSQHGAISAAANTGLNPVSERTPSPSSAVSRPKSMDYSGNAASGTNSSPLFSRSPRLSEHFEQDEQQTVSQQANAQATQAGGSWASMVNTPMAPNFDTNKTGANTAMDSAAQKLAAWNASNGPNRMVLDDARKFRRTSKGSGLPGSPTLSPSVNVNNPPLSAALPSMYDHSNFNALRSAGLPQTNNQWPSNVRSPATGDFSSGATNDFGLGMMGMMPTQMQLAAYNNMNASGGNMGQLGMFAPTSNALVNAQAQMIALNMMNQQLVAQQQQLAGGPRSARGFGGTPTSARRSPMRAAGSPNRPHDAPVTENVLQDIPNWLRTLRLHKYTPNFEGSHWRDMVMMDDAALEAKGVAALGARRKMLKTFEEVRAQMGIPEPGSEQADLTEKAEDADAEAQVLEVPASIAN